MGFKVYSFAIVALLTGGGFASSVPAVSLQPRAQTACNTTLTSPPPKGYNCGTLGTLTSPKLLNAAPADTLNECIVRCKVDNANKCISFAYNQRTKECRMYRVTLNKQGYKDKKTNTGFVYWNRRCWTVSGCTTPCDNPVPPEGDLVTNGGFECGLKSWRNTVTSPDFIANTSSPGYDSPMAYQISGTGTGEAGQVALLAQTVKYPPEGPLTYSVDFAVKFAEGDSYLQVSLTRVPDTPFLTVFSGESPLNRYRLTGGVFTLAQGGTLDLSFSFGLAVITNNPTTISLDAVSITKSDLPADCANPPTVSDDLVTDGQFHCGFTAWDGTPVGNGTAFIAAPGHDSDNSFQVYDSPAPGAFPAPIARLEQTISVNAETDYTLAFWVYFTDRAYSVTALLDGTGLITVDAQSSGGPNQFNQVSIPVRSDTSGSRTLSFRVIRSGVTISPSLTMISDISLQF